MTENEMAEALRLARNVIKTNTGCPTAALQLARALIACREPVKIQLADVKSSGEVHAEWYRCPSCEGLVTALAALGMPDFCPNCGRPLVWK